MATPFKEDHEASLYYIRCLMGGPVRLWTSHDWSLLKAILDALANNVHNKTPSEVRLAKKIDRKMRDNIEPELAEYLAYQLHLEEAHVQVSDAHMARIYSNGWDHLLRWSPVPAVPTPRNTQGWKEWARQQRRLMSPSRQDLQRMPVAARKFKTAVLKNLFIRGVNRGGIEWEVHGLVLSDDPLEVRALFEEASVVSPGDEEMDFMLQLEASQPQVDGADNYLGGSFFQPDTAPDSDSDIRGRPTKRQRTRRDQNQNQSPAHEQDEKTHRENTPALEQSLRSAHKRDKRDKLTLRENPTARKQSLRNALIKHDAPVYEQSLVDVQVKHGLPVLEQSPGNAESKNDLPAHEQSLGNAESKNDPPVHEQSLGDAESKHDPTVHEQHHQKQEPQNPRGKQEPQGSGAVQSKHDSPVHEKNLEDAESKNDPPAHEQSLGNTESKHDTPVHEKKHQTQEPQNLQGEKAPQGSQGSDTKDNNWAARVVSEAEGPLAHGVSEPRDAATAHADFIHATLDALEEMKAYFDNKMAMPSQRLQAQIDDLVAGRELEREQLRQQVREGVIAEIRNKIEDMVENGDIPQVLTMLMGNEFWRALAG